MSLAPPGHVVSCQERMTLAHLMLAELDKVAVTSQ